VESSLLPFFKFGARKNRMSQMFELSRVTTTILYCSGRERLRFRESEVVTGGVFHSPSRLESQCETSVVQREDLFGEGPSNLTYCLSGRTIHSYDSQKTTTRNRAKNPAEDVTP